MIRKGQVEGATVTVYCYLCGSKERLITLLILLNLIGLQSQKLVV